MLKFDNPLKKKFLQTFTFMHNFQKHKVDQRAKFVLQNFLFDAIQPEIMIKKVL